MDNMDINCDLKRSEGRIVLCIPWLGLAWTAHLFFFGEVCLAGRFMARVAGRLLSQMETAKHFFLTSVLISLACSGYYSGLWKKGEGGGGVSFIWWLLV